MHYNGVNSYLFVNGTEVIKFKGYTKGYWNGYVYDFSVDYNAIAVTDILDIRKYLMKKHDIK